MACHRCKGGVQWSAIRLKAFAPQVSYGRMARACHAETFFVSHSSMLQWVKGAEKTVVIDGCFLKCHGRVLKELVGEGHIIHIDALPLHKRYTDIFLMDDVPEDERKAVD